MEQQKKAYYIEPGQEKFHKVQQVQLGAIKFMQRMRKSLSSVNYLTKTTQRNGKTSFGPMCHMYNTIMTEKMMPMTKRSLRFMRCSII